MCTLAFSAVILLVTPPCVLVLWMCFCCLHLFRYPCQARSVLAAGVAQPSWPSSVYASQALAPAPQPAFTGFWPLWLHPSSIVSPFFSLLHHFGITFHGLTGFHQCLSVLSHREARSGWTTPGDKTLGSQGLLICDIGIHCCNGCTVYFVGFLGPSE